MLMFHLSVKNPWIRFAYGLWEVVLGFLLSFFIPFVFGNIVFQILLMSFPELMYIVPLTAFAYWPSFLLFLALMVGFLWLPVLLLIFVVRGAKRFRRGGIQTSPLLWGIGMIPPLSYVVYPLYRVMSRVVWPRRLQQSA